MDTISSGIPNSHFQPLDSSRNLGEAVGTDDPVAKPDSVELSSGASSLANKKICIDPGHGGGDSGAVGPTKFTEKEANLDIALDLKQYLEGQGAKVIMTRQTDTSLTSAVSGHDELAARVKVANDSKADIFISIHNNASDSPSSNGTETYYYSKGSEASKLLAKTVFDHQIAKTGLHPRGTFPANFYVIKYTDMPGMLSESAFISNPAEEAKLKDPAFRQTIAEGIGEGIQEYFAKTEAGTVNVHKPDLPDDGKWEPLPCEKYVTVAS